MTNDPTVVLTSSDSSIEVTKTAVVNDTNSNSKTDQGDVIVYNISGTQHRKYYPK